MDFNKFRCDGTIRATFILPSVSLSWSIFTSVFSLEFLQKMSLSFRLGAYFRYRCDNELKIYRPPFPPWLPFPSLYLLLGLFSIFFLSMPSGKRRALFTHTHTLRPGRVSLFSMKKKNDSRDDIWIEIDKANLYSQRKTQKSSILFLSVCLVVRERRK